MEGGVVNPLIVLNHVIVFGGLENIFDVISI